jgi:hypothetical protein
MTSTDAPLPIQLDAAPAAEEAAAVPNTPARVTAITTEMAGIMEMAEATPMVEAAEAERRAAVERPVDAEVAVAAAVAAEAEAREP